MELTGLRALGGVAVAVTVDGQPVGPAFLARLVSLSVTDCEGIEADRIELVFDDGPPHIAPPKRGAELALSMGGFAGRYVIDAIEHRGLPYELVLRGHAADLRGSLRSSRTRHWQDISLAEILTQIAKAHDLTPKIAEGLAAHRYRWIAQQDESDLAFLGRLARRHGALFTIKSGHLLWLARGRAETAQGDTVPLAVLRPAQLVRNGLRVIEEDVARFAQVRAQFRQSTDGDASALPQTAEAVFDILDGASAARGSVTVPGVAGAVGVQTLSEVFGSRSEALWAAQATARAMAQGQVTLEATVVGCPDLMAGQPLRLEGLRPGLGIREFVISQVDHRLSKASGLMTRLQARLRAPQSPGEGAGTAPDQ